jgi:hypothetical protein
LVLHRHRFAVGAVDGPEVMAIQPDGVPAYAVH